MSNELISHLEIIHQLPGYFGWKDINGYYNGCNIALANVLQLSSPEAIIGLTDKDLIDCTETSLVLHRENDLLALNGQTIQAIIPASKPYLASFCSLTKKPLLNQAHQIVGVTFHCLELTNQSKMKRLIQIDRKKCAPECLPKQYQFSQYHENPKDLSTRELETLFCILRGKTAKETAVVLNLSKRTIEFYINNIKNKFGCNTKSELLMQAITMGYMTLIPDLFRQNKYENTLY